MEDKQHKVELTQPAYFNPYDTNPYSQELPNIPPAPPSSLKERYKKVLLYLFIAFCISGIAASVFFTAQASIYYHALSVATSSRSVTKVSPLVSPSPSLTVSPAAIPQDYTAIDIMNDLGNAGIHPKFVEYNRTIWSWSSDTYYVSVHATTSANFTDDSACTGYCDPANIGIWVYSSKAEAQQAFVEVHNDVQQALLTPPTSPMIIPSVEYVHGRCLLIGADQRSIYGQVVTRYCV